MKITIYSLAFNLIGVFMAKKGVSKKGGSGDINDEVAKIILAAVSNGQESVSFDDIVISKTDPDLVNNAINKLLYSGEKNAYSLERILYRRNPAMEGTVGVSVDKKLEELKGQYIKQLINDRSDQNASTLQTGALHQVLGAGSVSSKDGGGSFEGASSHTSEGSYNVSDSNSSAKKRGIFSRIKDSLAKICGSSKKEDSLHGSVTADFVVNDTKQGAFARTEESMAREQVEKDMRLREKQRMIQESLARKKESGKQIKREERSEQKALKQKSQAPEQRGQSMFERLKGYWSKSKVVVIKTYSRDQGYWHETSETKIGCQELKNGARAAVRGAGSAATGAATGAAEVVKNVGAGLGYMTSGWKEGATGPLDVARAAAGFMSKNGGSSIGGNLKSVGAAAAFMAPSGPPSRKQIAGAAKLTGIAARGAASAAGEVGGAALRAVRDVSMSVGLGRR